MEILSLSQCVTGTLTLDDSTLGRLVLHIGDPEKAAKVEEQAKVFQQKWRDEVEEQRKRFAELGDMPAQFREMMEQQAVLQEQIIGALAVTKAEGSVLVTLKRVKGLEEAFLKLLHQWAQ
jgi:predicted XRE-type DNA-binding protein